MSDKLKLFELGFNKVSSDNSFIGFFLIKYAEIEKLSESDLISELKCSSENYYKLGLCKVPGTNDIDFIDRLNKISQYANVSVLELNKIIKRVDSIIKFNVSIHTDTILMAARDKKGGNKVK